jgi:hypothetical protein
MSLSVFVVKCFWHGLLAKILLWCLSTPLAEEHTNETKDRLKQPLGAVSLFHVA